MRCIVTAGPTYEPLDAVRRLTNFSSGRLGAELANYLAGRGHEVILLIGEQAAWGGDTFAAQSFKFTTTTDLRDRLQALGGRSVNAVFHAAAVSDFAFGKVWCRSAEGRLSEIRSGKISTRKGALLAELVPTPKIISALRQWFPQASLVGWKYEVDGSRAKAIKLARMQIAECLTDGCVANGPAYGKGFGLVIPRGETKHFAGKPALFKALARFVG
jgi:phosphopantothenoylcysteine synthetase/decarboxylase